MDVQQILVGLGLALGGTIVSAVAVSAVLIALPPDYFERSTAPSPRGVKSIVWRISRNVLGCVLILLGVVFLFTPGQGLLTILLGLALVDFPGKYRLERGIIANPRIFRTINDLRRRFGRPPLRHRRDAARATQPEENSRSRPPEASRVNR